MRFACLAMVSLVFSVHPLSAQSRSAQPPPASVAVAVVTEGKVTRQISLVGAIKEARRTIIGSAVDGRVVELLVNDGNFVEKRGQAIAQLLTSTIEIEIEAAQAELELRLEELKELEAGTRPEERDQARARRDSAAALKDYADARFARLKTLYDQQRTISLEEYEEAYSGALAANHAYQAAQAAFELAEKGPRDEQVAQAKARVRGQQAEVDRLTDLMRKYTIRAPFPGYVVAKQTEVGAWVSKGDPVAEVIELDHVDVEVSVPENFIAEVQVGDQVPITVDALADKNETLDHVGKVDRIVPSADLRSRSFPVKIRLANPKTEDGHVLKAGMLARATVSGGTYPALLVPKDALVTDRGLTRVILAVPDSRSGQHVARSIRVEPGLEKGGWIEVRGELEAGQQVITRGNERVRQGQKLQIVAIGEQPSSR